MASALQPGVTALLAALLASPALAADGAQGPVGGEWLGHTGARIGVQVHSLTPELRDYFGVERERGVLVARVEAGSPAEAAGIVPGDVIVEADGQPIASPHGLIRHVQRRPVGEPIDIVLVRRGGEQRLRVAASPGSGARAAQHGQMRALVRELRDRIGELEARLESLEKRSED